MRRLEKAVIVGADDSVQALAGKKVRINDYLMAGEVLYLEVDDGIYATNSPIFREKFGIIAEYANGEGFSIEIQKLQSSANKNRHYLTITDVEVDGDEKSF